MKERLSITLNQELYKEVKRKADELHEPVSRIIEKAISAWRRDEIAESLKEYYVNAESGQEEIVKDAESLIDEVWK
ncbi:MAG: ribbon-helix-helix protein, CopG family [candidate division WOR-3 bacterium]|jgi:predicted transcriptional regulator